MTVWPIARRRLPRLLVDTALHLDLAGVGVDHEARQVHRLLHVEPEVEVTGQELLLTHRLVLPAHHPEAQCDAIPRGMPSPG